jgi:hypothetical protein
LGWVTKKRDWGVRKMSSMTGRLFSLYSKLFRTAAVAVRLDTEFESELSCGTNGLSDRTDHIERYSVLSHVDVFLMSMKLRY